MADQYILELYNSLDADIELKNLIRKLFDVLLQKFLDRRNIEISINPEHKAIKKIRIKTAENSLNSKSVPQINSREEFSKDLKQKEAETKEFTKKLKSDQEKREQRQKKREQAEKLKQFEELKFLEKLKQEDFDRHEAEKLKRLQDLKEKSFKRKQQIKELIDLGKQEYKKVITSKPLHEKIHENYNAKILMPDLERHKQELAKIHEAFQPISRSVILEHAKKHDQLIEEHEIRKRDYSQKVSYNPAKMRSKFTKTYIKDLKEKKQELYKEFLDKKARADKKKQYSKLVLEMFQPVVDPSKQMELRIIRERLEGAASEMGKKKSAKSLGFRDNSLTETHKKRKWKKNMMIPDTPVKKKPVIVDWLGEKKKERENLNEDKDKDRDRDSDDWDSKVPEIRNRVKKLERKLRKGEIELSISKQNDLKGVEFSDYVNGMLISCIKGKLAIIEKNNINSEF